MNEFGFTCYLVLQDVGTARDQVLCDLVCFFNNVLRVYSPALAAGIVPAALQPAQSGTHGKGLGGDNAIGRQAEGICESSRQALA